MPKVSVIMSVYNGEEYLREAIDSILNQTFEDFEFIIVDDGSTDRIADILASYRDPRIKVINQKHLGIAHAKNKAVKASSGEYIAIMDADDISLPERLEVEASFLNHNRDIGIVSCSNYFVDEYGKTILTRSALIGYVLIQKKLLEDMCVNHCSAMIRRKVFKEVGGYRRAFKCSLDYDLFLRIAEVSKIENIKEPLHKYRIRIDSISVAKKVEQDAYAELARRLARERRQCGKDRLEDLNEKKLKAILKGISLEIKKKNNLHDMYYYWAERFYLRDNYKNAFRYLCRSILYRPFNKEGVSLFLKTCIHLMISQRIIDKLKTIKLN